MSPARIELAFNFHPLPLFIGKTAKTQRLIGLIQNESQNMSTDFREVRQRSIADFGRTIIAPVQLV
jgi:hypothetical protein